MVAVATGDTIIMDDVMNNQIRRLVEGSRLVAAASAGAAASTGETRGANARDLDDLRRCLREQWRGLDSRAPDYEQQALRAFIVAVLAWQFGRSLLQDRRTVAMIDSIERAIAASPAAGRRLAEAIAALTTDR